MNNSTNVMAIAHTATYAMMDQLGGKHSDYFKECLKQAHKANKRAIELKDKSQEKVRCFEFSSIALLLVVLFVIGGLGGITTLIMFKAGMLAFGYTLTAGMLFLVSWLSYTVIDGACWIVTREKSFRGGYGTVICAV